MSKRSGGEKRPADLVGATVEVMPTAIAEEQDERETASSAAAALGKLGGTARAKSLTAEQRSAIARKAAAGRWHSQVDK